MIDIPIDELKEKLRFKSENNQSLVFDIVRKKYVVLLPEELVRQLLVHYLIEKGGYPLSRFQIERGTYHVGKKGRFDIVIYDKAVKPWMLIECKSHKVKLNQSTIDQLGGYNSSIKAPYLMICNGINTLCYKSENTKDGYVPLESLPEYGL